MTKVINLTTEATIVAMANALDRVERLDHEGARLIAYARAGIRAGDAVAYDRDAFARQRQRRNMRAARDGASMTAMFAGILALGCVAPDGEAMAATATAHEQTWGAALATLIMIAASIVMICAVALGLMERWNTRHKRRRTAALMANIERDAEHAARMASGGAEAAQ